GPAELERHPRLAFAAAPSLAAWTLRSDGKSVEVSAPPRLVVNDFELLREAAVAGLGIASLPASVWRGDFAPGPPRPVPAKWCSEETPLHAVYPSTRHLSPKVTAFVELLRARLPALVARN